MNCGAMNRKLAEKGKRVSTVFMRSMIAQQRSLKKPEAVSVAGQPCPDIIVSDPSRKRFHCHEVCLYKKLVQKIAQGQMEVFCQSLAYIAYRMFFMLCLFLVNLTGGMRRGIKSTEYKPGNRNWPLRGVQKSYHISCHRYTQY